MLYLLFGAKFILRGFSEIATEQCPKWIYVPGDSLATIPDAIMSFTGKMIFIDLFTPVMISASADQETWPKVCTEVSEIFFGILAVICDQIDREVSFDVSIIKIKPF